MSAIVEPGCPSTLIDVLGKVAKVVGFVGAVGAVAWAMRDRFISVAVSREPEPPAFRGSTRGVESVEGVGPVFASRLSEAGLGSLSTLAGSAPERVAEAAGVSTARAKAWIDRAAELF
jgi:predicted flap endonuclease-1-like 5' DNA nuclease